MIQQILPAGTIEPLQFSEWSGPYQIWKEHTDFRFVVPFWNVGDSKATAAENEGQLLHFYPSKN